MKQKDIEEKIEGLYTPVGKLSYLHEVETKHPGLLSDETREAIERIKKEYGEWKVGETIYSSGERNGFPEEFTKSLIRVGCEKRDIFDELKDTKLKIADLGNKRVGQAIQEEYLMELHSFEEHLDYRFEEAKRYNRGEDYIKNTFEYLESDFGTVRKGVESNVAPPNEEVIKAYQNLYSKLIRKGYLDGATKISKASNVSLENKTIEENYPDIIRKLGRSYNIKNIEELIKYAKRKLDRIEDKSLREITEGLMKIRYCNLAYEGKFQKMAHEIDVTNIKPEVEDVGFILSTSHGYISLVKELEDCLSAKKSDRKKRKKIFNKMGKELRLQGLGQFLLQLEGIV